MQYVTYMLWFITTQYATLKCFFHNFLECGLKNQPKHITYPPPGLLVPALFPYQPIFTDLKTKATIIVLHESGNYLAHQSSSSNT